MHAWQTDAPLAGWCWWAGAGEHGGTIVHSGTYKQLLKNKDSITGQYLSGKRSIPVPGTRRPGNGNIVTGMASGDIYSEKAQPPGGRRRRGTFNPGSGSSSP